MLTIVAGMLLSCSVKIHAPGPYGSFVKDVPTKVLYVDPKKDENGFEQVLVEYQWDKAPGIRVIGDDTEKEMITKGDMLRKDYGNCKELK